MKDSRILYVLVFVLITLAIFSIKSTLKNMTKSGQEVDHIFLEVCTTFTNMDSTLKSLNEIIGHQDLTFKDSFQLIYISHPPKISEGYIVDFVTFNKYLKFHNNLMENADTVLKYFKDHPTEKTDLLETLLIDLSFDKIQTGELREEYNNRARIHNAYIKKFPRNFYSSFFHFQSKPYFK